MQAETTLDGYAAVGLYTIEPQPGCTDVRATLDTLYEKVDLGLVACLPGTNLADAERFVVRRSRIGFRSAECLDSITTRGR